MTQQQFVNVGALALGAWILAFASASLESGQPAAARGASSVPARLSETGLFSDVASLTPAAGVVPYEVNVPFWSDGALKRRWMALPGDGIERRIPRRTGSSSSRESHGRSRPARCSSSSSASPTLLGRQACATSKRASSSATRTAACMASPTNGMPRAPTPSCSQAPCRRRSPYGTSDGSTVQQQWDYPTPDYCQMCHNQAAGGVLGVTYRQIDRTIQYRANSPEVNQIAEWNRIGMLSKSLDEPKALAPWNLVRLPARLPVPFWNLRQAGSMPPMDDRSASLEDRARSYLDSNCSYCHAPGIVSADWNARSTTPLAEQAIVGARARIPRPGADLIVTPGAPEASLLYLRVVTNDPALRMPPLGRNAVDHEGARLLYDWIKSMPATAVPGPAGPR